MHLSVLVLWLWLNVRARMWLWGALPLLYKLPTLCFQYSITCVWTESLRLAYYSTSNKRMYFSVKTCVFENVLQLELSSTSLFMCVGTIKVCMILCGVKVILTSNDVLLLRYIHIGVEKEESKCCHFLNTSISDLNQLKERVGPWNNPNTTEV